jgi:hypothetical protein
MSTQPSHPTNQPSPTASQQPSAEAQATSAPNSWPDASWPETLPPLGSDPAIIASTPPEILEAQRVFLQDLPELLKTRRGQWVAYYGTERLGFGATKDALWDECCARGYQEFLIRRIRPRAEFEFISAL